MRNPDRHSYAVAGRRIHELGERIKKAGIMVTGKGSAMTSIGAGMLPLGDGQFYEQALREEIGRIDLTLAEIKRELDMLRT